MGSGVGDGQGGLVSWDSWGCKESDTTEQMNWTEGDIVSSVGWDPAFDSGREKGCYRNTGETRINFVVNVIVSRFISYFSRKLIMPVIEKKNLNEAWNFSSNSVNIKNYVV